MYIQNPTNIMAKRTATPVRPWNAPKRRKTSQRQQITLAQLPPSVRPEVKFSDRQASGSASFFAISLRPDFSSTYQGDDGDQMVGSECYLKAVDYTLSLPTSGWTLCRVSIIIPRDPSISATALAPAQRYGHREFVVLHDEVFSVNEKNHCRIKNFPLKMKQKWSVSGAVINEGNAIVVANLDTSTAGVVSYARTYFTDP